ncbi:hypothetical protein KP509_15G038600 [Ceratopteris richardii]|nr:hypothetical protein KP509_15G038600 [Ceratopteris richardii]
MMVGFISIALTIGQKSFSKICMPSKLSKSLLLCNKDNEGINLEGRLTLDTGERILATVSVNASEVCGADQTLFMPAESLHQLHILIFMLAIVHIFYTVLIVLLGMWSVSHWKAWEERANTKEALSAHGGIRLTRETTFMRSHILGEWMGNTIASYLVAFYKQFHTIINDTDYYTLRKGFIKNHMPKNPDFNFHKYIRRSLQDDFKHVVGISPLLWGYALLWLFLNVDGWESNIIIAVIPLILVLAIGTKLQHVMMRMAVLFSSKHPLTLGLPMVKPNDNFFWFNRPRFILLCIHFILFQNALEISFNLWAAMTFSSDNCLYRHPSFLIGRMVIGMIVQVTCGTITLPIYALVSQMGSSVKRTIFREHIMEGIIRWHKRAKDRVKARAAREQGHKSGAATTKSVSFSSSLLHDVDSPTLPPHVLSLGGVHGAATTTLHIVSEEEGSSRPTMPSHNLHVTELVLHTFRDL